MLLTKSSSERSNQKLKKRCRKMADELEKAALDEILRTALFIVTRLDELEAKIDQNSQNHEILEQRSDIQ